MNYCKKCASDVAEELNKDGNCIACAEVVKNAAQLEKDIKDGKIKILDKKSSSKKKEDK